MPKNSKILIILSILSVTLLCGSVYAQDEGWDTFSTRYCTVSYKEDVNLKYVNRRISLRTSDYYNPRRYRNSELSIEEIVGEKLDAIFSKVEDILDMYPSKIHVNLRIYKDRSGLDAEYYRIFNEPNKAISFYVYKYNTIYTTEHAIKEGILAHEMAHCIIDHYFVILPPRKIQEMLAIYADVHLKD